MKQVTTSVSVLPVDSITLVRECYPRFLSKKNDDPFWVVTWKYVRRLESGAVFPPIVVAKIDAKNVLVDGLHRLRAYEKLHKKDIPVEFILCRNYDDVYQEAVSRNTVHGADLSTFEMVTAISRFRKLGKSWQEIGEIVHASAKYVKEISQRRTKELPNSKVSIPIKKIFEKNPSVINSVEEERLYSSGSQTIVLSQAIELFRKGQIDLDNKEVIKLVQELKIELDKVMT